MSIRCKADREVASIWFLKWQTDESDARVRTCVSCLGICKPEAQRQQVCPAHQHPIEDNLGVARQAAAAVTDAAELGIVAPRQRWSGRGAMDQPSQLQTILFRALRLWQL